MGNLVFQATLGGQVNLVGPNTASTFNLNVPAVSATLATTAANTFTAVQTLTAGSASAPALTTTGDTNTGIFFPAADTIAFSEGGVEAARFDSSGNLGIGTTSPTYPITIERASQSTLEIKSGSTTGESRIYFSDTTTAIGAIEYQHNGDFMRFYTNNAERMRLDSSGNFMVGTTTPLQTASNRGNITVNGSASSIFNMGVNGSVAAYIFASSTSATYEVAGTNTISASGANVIALNTNGSERARIDSSGNLLVGTTSGQNGGSTFSGLLTSYRATSTTSNAVFLVSSDVGGTANVNFRVLASGNAQNTNNSYGAISDVKLKENITNATPKLAQLNQVRVVNYNLIGDANKQLGVIAQELEQIFPNMVEETADKDSEGNDLGTTTKSVKYSVFVPMLIKAIQELKAEIDELKGQA